MSSLAAEQFAAQFEWARKALAKRLVGLDDAEYLWEPVDGCWSVHLRSNVRSTRPWGTGDWVLDGAEDDPSPPPFTTTAWRLVHLVDVIGVYHPVLFGGEVLPDNWFEIPSTAAQAISLWGHHAQAFAEAMKAESDDTLQRIMRVPWWPREAARSEVIGNVVNELTHHGAEIGVLRDLYRDRHSLRA